MAQEDEGQYAVVALTFTQIYDVHVWIFIRFIKNYDILKTKFVFHHFVIQAPKLCPKDLLSSRHFAPILNGTSMCTFLILRDVEVGTTLTCLELLINHFLPHPSKKQTNKQTKLFFLNSEKSSFWQMICRENGGHLGSGGHLWVLAAIFEFWIVLNSFKSS